MIRETERRRIPYGNLGWRSKHKKQNQCVENDDEWFNKIRISLVKLIDMFEYLSW